MRFLLNTSLLLFFVLIVVIVGSLLNTDLLLFLGVIIYFVGGMFYLFGIPSKKRIGIINKSRKKESKRQLTDNDILHRHRIVGVIFVFVAIIFLSSFLVP